MTLRSDVVALNRLIQRARRRRQLRHEVESRLAARPDLPTNHFQVVVYFADKLVNLYQIRQWYEPMRKLAERYPAAVVARSVGATSVLLDECPLPVFYGPTVGDIETFVASQPIKVAFYVNQNMRNFQMMRFPSMFHVFVSHGESDKIYMASNQAKAYDFCFVAGDAAVGRIGSRLLDFDAGKRLIRIGRPQVDVVGPGPRLPGDGRQVVLYAPTWEGDRPSMTYGSVRSHGLPLVDALVRSGRYRVIYRPHPRTGVFDPAAAAANTAIAARLRRANRLDPSAGHLVDESPDYGWQLRAADTCVCDISAVAFDWLATGKPLLLTEPTAPEAEVDKEGIAGQVRMLSAAEAPGCVGIIDGLGDAATRKLYAAITEHYFGDISPGASMARFIDACEHVMALRDKAAAPVPSIIDLTALDSPTVPSSAVPVARVDVMGDEDRDDLQGLDA